MSSEIDAKQNVEPLKEAPRYSRFSKEEKFDGALFLAKAISAF